MVEAIFFARFSLRVDPRLFVAQAHSFVQQARLAITLAWIAGYTNIITILTCGTVTSHVSGTTSNLGREVAERSWSLAGFSLFLLTTFLVGAMISGLSTEFGRRRLWESIYVLPMAIEALFLAAFAFGLEVHAHRVIENGSGLYLMTGLACMAMGLQNATITRISSGVVRTTHVTGVLTDLGLELVQFFYWLRDRSRPHPPGSSTSLIRSLHTHPTARRLALLASILGSFALGACLGTLAFDRFPRWAMFPPVLFLAWIIYQDVTRPIVEIEPSSTLGDAADLPASLAVFHLRKDRDRHGHIHRMPNLLAWSDRIPPETRVVILDLGEVTRLDANAAEELRALLLRFSVQGRRLVISGMTGEQYEQLRRAGTGALLDPMSVCPDLELAVARGLNLLEDLMRPVD